MFDAPIVKNLTISQIEQDTDNLLGKGGVDFEKYRIVLATRANSIYHVTFNGMFMAQNKSVGVVKDKGLIDSTLKGEQ